MNVLYSSTKLLRSRLSLSIAICSSARKALSRRSLLMRSSTVCRLYVIPTASASAHTHGANPSQDPRTVSKIHSIYQDILCKCRYAAARSTVVFDLSANPYNYSPEAAQRTMISLAGVLLEYPFVYYIQLDLPDFISASCIDGARLFVIELILTDVTK